MSSYFKIPLIIAYAVSYSYSLLVVSFHILFYYENKCKGKSALKYL